MSTKPNPKPSKPSPVATKPSPELSPLEKARAARVKVDPNETPADKFRRLGKARLKVALKAIARVGNLSGGGYEYTTEQANTVVAALADAVRKVSGKFSETKAKESEPEINL